MSHIAHSLLRRRRSEPLRKRSKFNRRVYSMAKGSSQITSFSERASALGQCRNLKMAGSAHAIEPSVSAMGRKFPTWQSPHIPTEQQRSAEDNGALDDGGQGCPE